MKKYFYTAAILTISLVGFGQTLQETIIKTENENFDAAASGFRALIAKDPTKGEYYFYYGENFFKRGEADSSNIYYKKGSEINATNPLNYVGLGKVLLSKGNINEARTQFFKATSLGANKNAEVLRKVAEAWLVTETRNADEAMAIAANAIKMDAKNPENYILLGDAQLEKNPADGSTPIKSYQTATNLNPKSTKGILREGKLYQRGRNYQLALDYYKKAIGIDPNFAPAYREIAELYSMVAQPAKSIENWKKYLELNNSDYARYRFMSALYANKQFSDAIAQYEGLKKANYNSVYLERLAGYSYEEMGDKTDKEAYTKGMAAINRFFEMAGSDFKYIANDYKYKGILLARTGKDSLGLIEIEKAIAMDSAVRGDAYGKLAKIAMDTKNYEKVVMYLEKKKRNDYKNLNNNDCFDLGKAYYFTGIKKQKEANEMKDALTKKKKPTDNPEVNGKENEAFDLFSKADSAFKKLTQLNPLWPVGYTWRGRANSLTDPKALRDSTKVYYEKVLELVKPEEKTGTYRNNVIEAYEYLGFYYASRKEEEKAKEIWSIVKEIDPTNEKVGALERAKKQQQQAPKPAPKK